MTQARTESFWLTRTVEALLSRRLQVLAAVAVVTLLLAAATLKLSFTTSPESVLHSSYPEHFTSTI